MFNNGKNTIRRGVQPLGKLLSQTNPNLITLTGLVLAITAGILLAARYLALGGIFILLSGFFDVLDGSVAREANRITAYGGFIDSVSDRYADAAILIGAMCSGQIAMPYPASIPWFWGAVALIGSYMVSYTRAKAEAAGTSATIGIAERSERLIIIAAGAIIGYLNIAVFVVAILTHITTIQRIYHVKTTLKRK